MVAIFVGQGAGFARGSGNLLGGAGLLGSGSFGRGAENVSVNAATGSLLISQQDEFLTGNGLDASIGRTYNSIGDASGGDGDNGDNWQQSTMRRVFGLTGTQDSAGSTIKRQGADGAVITYTWNAAKSAYVATDGDGSHDELRKVAGNWMWTDGSSRFTDTYGAYGADNWRIISATGKEHFGLTFSYVGDKLDKVTTASGEYTQYSWSGNNITQIVTSYTDLATSTAKTLTRTRYAYDGSNRLTTVTVDLSPGDNAVTDGKTFVTTYTYDGTSTRVASLSTTGGSNIAVTYDGSGRVLTLTETVATGDTRVTTLSYQTGYTNVTGPDNKVTRLDYDASSRLTKITLPPAVSGATAQTVAFTYDGSGNVSSVKDSTGEITSYTYDASGNILTVTDPNSNVVTRTYSAKNELLTETRTGSDASGSAVSHTTRYAYDSASHLRFIVSSEGHVTEYAWSGANQYWTTEYPQQAYDLTGLSSTTAITESQLTTWRTTFNNTRDKIIFDQFDTRGNLIKRTRYGSGIATWGNGSTAEGYSESFYSYDQAGRLISRYDNGVLAETFVYDGLGRVTASGSPATGTTTIVFNDGSLTTTVTTATGYSSVSTYNKAGDLISVATSGSYDVSGTTAYKYDKLGRIRMVTTPLGVASTGDPNDYNSFVLYDNAGRKTADIAADGSIVEYRYDAANRLAATIAYATKLNATQMGNLATAGGIAEVATYRPTGVAADIWNWNVYDDAGRLIQSIDGNGGVVDFYYDNSNQLIRTVGYSAKLTVTAFKTTLPTTRQTVTTGTEDRVSRTFYDQDGRLIGTLNGEGYFSEIVYDKAGQKVEEIAYATKPAVSWTTSSFNQLRTSAGTAVATNRRVRYVYDGQGLLRYQVDGLGHVSRFEYDLGQRLTTTIAYAATISPADFTYATAKSAVTAIANDLGDRKSWSVYNDKGQVAYAIDAGGFVTAFAYDAGGRAIKATSYATNRATTSLPTRATMDTWAAGQASNSSNRVSRTYYSAGSVVRFTVDAEGYRTKSVFDANGNLLSTTLSANALTVTDSTTIAQLEAMSGGTALTTGFTYDPSGRLLTTTNAEAGVTTYEYNALGQVVKITDPRGQSTGKATYHYYDAAGRLTMVRDAEDYVTQTSYNAFGEVASVTRNYNKTASSYSTTTAPTVTANSTKDAVTYYYYDDLGWLTYTVDAEKAVTRSYYNGFGEVAKVVRYATTYNATAATTIAQLDSNFGAATTVPPGNASITSFAYDNLGRVTTSTDALTVSESYGYDAFGNRTSVTNKLGGVTNYAYDKRGLLTSETLPISSYLANGTVQGAIVNTYGYDAFGNRTQMVEGAGLSEARTTIYEYDRLGRLKKTIKQARTWLNQTDHKTETTGFTPTEEIAYDAVGNVIRVVDAAGNRSVHFYDDIGRKIVSIDAAGTFTRHSYDANGNVTSTRVYETPVTLPANGGRDTDSGATPPSGFYRETLFGYDNLGRLTKSSVTATNASYPAALGSYNGSSWVAGSAPIDFLYQYDSFGNVVKTTDANTNATWSYYDRLGRKTVQIDALNYRTDWTYDHEGNVLVELRSANQTATPSSVETPPAVTANAALDRETRYTYDKNGNRLSEERRDVAVHNDASPGTTTTVHAKVEWRYNGLGQVTRKTEATGDQTNYSYDNGGRLTQERRAAFISHQGSSVTPTADYRYDGLGDLVRTVAAGAGDAADRITTYAYGAGGLLSSITDAEGGVHEYSYDKLGIQIRDRYSRVDSAGTATTNGVLTKVDVLGRTTEQSVGSWNGSVWTKGDIATTEYNAFGEVKRSGINGLWQTENLYDAAGRLRATNAGDGVWKAFGYDKNGNQTIAISLSGTGDSLSGLTFAQAVAKISQLNVNATYTVYDKRNMATSSVEEGRQINGGAAKTLVADRSYNGFGEVTTETARYDLADLVTQRAVTTYSYNKMGRMVRSEGPTVEVTYDNGTTQWIKPATDQYYDRSGRLVATRDANGTYASGGTASAGASKAANTGNLTRLTLLAGTGYNGSEAIMVAETHADGGVKQVKYDVHGDSRTLIDEVGREVAQSFDRMGRLVERKELRRKYYPSTTTLFTTDDFIETFQYDSLGQRLAHWNNFLGMGNKETTDYDVQGRVVSSRSFGGDVTTTSYGWNATLAAIAGVTTGGWEEITSMANGRTLTERSDIFGRVVWKEDLGDRITTYGYDAAGRQTSSTIGATTATFTYFNMGWVATNSGPNGLATYAYDTLGNRTSETLVAGGVTVKSQAATYDALGRLKTWAEAGNANNLAASTIQSYDANGNIRSTAATYQTRPVFAGDPPQTQSVTYWYLYDNMNRLTVDKAGLVNGVIGGDSGIKIAYDAAGQRVQVNRIRSVPTGFWFQIQDEKETYIYDEGGRLAEVKIAYGALIEPYIDPVTYQMVNTVPPPATGMGARRASFTYDAMGRQTNQSDYDTNGTTILFSKASTYNAKGQITQEITNRRDGTILYGSTTTFSYTDYSTSEYLLGTIGWTQSVNTINGGSSVTSRTTNSFQWFDMAVQTGIQHKPNISQGTTHSTSITLNAFGQAIAASISDGNARNLTFVNDESGQIITRIETKSTLTAYESSYRFMGRQMGTIGRNSPSGWSYSDSIGERVYSGSTTWLWGTTTSYGTQFIADFSQSIAPINSFAQGSTGGSYTVKGGETLQAIALAVYGDANLWYKIAEANGIGASGTLIDGQTLILPTGITRNTHNASTLKPYDPAEAMGDLSPTTPKPPKNPKCGGFGMILLAVVAIAVATVVTAGIAAATTPATFGQALTAVFSGTLGAAGTATASLGSLGVIGATAAGAVAGSVVSQGIGVATGLQDKFSWKGVALAGIGSAIGGGLGGFNAFGATSKFGVQSIANAAVRGALSSAISQGIGVATGLQSKFDFAGVAAAGVGAAAGEAIGGLVGGGARFDPATGKQISPATVGNFAASTSASAIANAATRSAINGESFGRNLIAAVPDVIAQILHKVVGDAMTGVKAPTSGANSDPVAASRVISQVPQEVRARVEAMGGRFVVAADGSVRVEGVTPKGLVEIVDQAQADTPELASGYDGVLIDPIGTRVFANDQGIGFVDTQSSIAAVNDAPYDGRGVNFEFLNGYAGSITSMWVGDQGSAIRFLMSGDTTVLYEGGTKVFADLGVRVSFGDQLSSNGFFTQVPTASFDSRSMFPTLIDTMGLDHPNSFYSIYSCGPMQKQQYMLRDGSVYTGTEHGLQAYKAIRDYNAFHTRLTSGPASSLAVTGTLVAGGDAAAQQRAFDIFAPLDEALSTRAVLGGGRVRSTPLGGSTAMSYQLGMGINYGRPSNFRAGVRDAVWDAAVRRSPDGLVRDPGSGRVMSRNEPWDMGHIPGREFRTLAAQARNVGMTRQDFLDLHNKVSHYRPELPAFNRSHRGELKIKY